jgi:histidine ammonia-lyase
VVGARGHPGQVAVASRLRELCGRTAGERRAGGPVHDPYPIRALAQVEGAFADALGALERVLDVELNAAAENPMIVDGEALASGNFHAGALALALDELRGALAQSVSLTAARVSMLLEPARSGGLPAVLADHPGPESGAMALEYTAQAAGADVRALTAPVTAQTVYLGWGAESHASFAPLAARRASQALAAAGVVIAVELVLARRALGLRGVTPPGEETRALLTSAAHRLGPVAGTDRPLGDDVEAARALLGLDASRGEPTERRS